MKTLALILVAALLSSCAYFSPRPETVAAAANCKIKAIETSDTFTPKLIFGLSSGRSTKVECH